MSKISIEHEVEEGKGKDSSRLELKNGEFVPDTSPRTRQEGQHVRPNSNRRSVLIFSNLVLEPPLWSEYSSVLAEYGWILIDGVDREEDYLTCFD